MSETKDAREVVAGLLELTRDEEMDCDAFQAHLAAMLEGTLDATLMALMEHHERICPECEEERKILMRALGIEPGNHPSG